MLTECHNATPAPLMMQRAHLARREMVQAKLDAELVLRRGAAQVDLVAKDEERHIVQLLAAEQLLRKNGRNALLKTSPHTRPPPAADA